MIEDIKLTIGTKVKIARNEAKLTQECLAFDVDVSVETISNIERGKVIPSIETLHKISRKLMFPIADFFLEPGRASAKQLKSKVKIIHYMKNLGSKELDLLLGQVELLNNYIAETK